MTARQSSPSETHSDSNVRKRVCKACDRCRLKKSKCDGANPCGRCRADNAICVFGERKKAHDKVYPKGYVEMLEQQQAWLVHGLQELYRRTADNQGWPGEPLKCESNGHPLTHDLLTRLGALDQSKGDHFEENTDTMQQKLWRHKPAQMQRQDSSDASSDGAQSPVTSTRFSVSDSFGRQLPPTPPSFSPSRTQQPQPGPASVKSEQMDNPAYAAQLSMQGVVNPIALQGPQWSGNGFSSPFDEMDLMPNDYTTMSFDDQPAYNRPLPLNCMTSTSFMDTKSDYEDFNQFLTNSAEIPSI